MRLPWRCYSLRTRSLPRTSRTGDPPPPRCMLLTLRSCDSAEDVHVHMNGMNHSRSKAQRDSGHEVSRRLKVAKILSFSSGASMVAWNKFSTLWLLSVGLTPAQVSSCRACPRGLTVALPCCWRLPPPAPAADWGDEISRPDSQGDLPACVGCDCGPQDSR